MAINNKCLVEPTQLGTSVALLYQAGVVTKAIVKKLTVANSSANAATVTIYLVPSGGTPGAGNIITDAAPVAPGKTYESYECEGHVLETGDSIQALASAASALALRASGIEVI